MSSNLLGPDQELFPDRYRWTVEEIHRLAREGRLTGRYEVIDGEVIREAGQKPANFLAIGPLVHWLNTLFADVFVRVQGPVCLPRPTAPTASLSRTLLSRAKR